MEIPGGNQSNYRSNKLMGNTMPANERENTDEEV